MQNYPVILTRPQMGENIGAAARVMMNFGYTDLRIVAPRDGWPNPKAESMAAGGKALIDSAQLYDTLADALADCQAAVALTARPREMELPVYTPREWAPQHDAALKTALVFGAERSGLENEEVALCNAVIQVPVAPAYPSLNLAQAVAVMCYEICATGKLPEAASADMASKEELHGFFDQLEEGLNAGNFWKVEQKKPAMWRNIRAMFQRTAYTSQEIRTLRGIVASLRRS
jgi:tRNA/rRNA methyltransferase